MISSMGKTDVHVMFTTTTVGELNSPGWCCSVVKSGSVGPFPPTNQRVPSASVSSSAAVVVSGVWRWVVTVILVV